MLLAIETSCDETAASIFELDSSKSLSLCLKSEVISSQIEAHKPYGGVVPELAAREHLTNLPVVIEKVLADAKCKIEDISAIACTQGPGLKVCLLVGFSFAKALAYSRGISFTPVNHLEGHLFAHELEEGGEQAEFPRLILLVSGGHTQLILAKAFRDYELIAETQDDAAGEAFDKSATVMGLPYPGGPALSKRAEKGNDQQFDLPIGMPKNDEAFSFSGLKTAVSRAAKTVDLSLESNVNDLAASTEKAIVDALLLKSLNAVKKYKPKSFVLAGGVAANKRLRKNFEQRLEIPFWVARHGWCTDNASMIAVVAAKSLGLSDKQDLSYLGQEVYARYPVSSVQG